MVSALPYLPRLPKRCVFFAASPACWGMGSLKTAKSLFLDPPEHMYYFPQFRYSAILYYSVILYGIMCLCFVREICIILKYLQY